MLWGEEDVALTKATTYGTEDYVRDLTIRYLPRVSHWVQQEAPEIVNPMIKAFLLGERVPRLRWVARLEGGGGPDPAALPPPGRRARRRPGSGRPAGCWAGGT